VAWPQWEVDEMELDSRQTIIMAILVLYLGRFLDGKFGFLRKFNIPESVAGGIAVSVFLGLLHLFFGFEFIFSLYFRDVLLVIFFTTIGLSTKWQTLVKGGRLFVIVTFLAVIFLFLQNFIGIVALLPFGIDAHYGLIGGSIALSGGHGTTIAWAPIFVEKYGAAKAMEFGIIVATLGLIFGGIVAGPVCNWLIKRHKLSSDSDAPITIGIKHSSKPAVDVDSMLKITLFIALGIGLGIYIQDVATSYFDVNLPLFVSSLLGGMLLTNITPQQKCPEGSLTLAMISDISLGIFLAMSLMSVKLWEIADAILPITVLMILQIMTIVLFAVFVFFRALGKNYDAAVMSAGYIGMALGATPVALANMTAISKKYGPSPIAFVLIPVVGAFFINFVNALVIEVMLRIFG